MYGNPTFRFTLSHDVLGSQVISEPQNWQESKLKLERHEDYYSLVEYFNGSFIFYGSNGQDDGGLEFIKSIESSFGVDAEINIVIEISFDDGETYETVFTGLLDLSDIQESKNNKAEIPIIRNDFWAKFINRRDTPVNIQSTESIDGTPTNVFDSVDIQLPSQKVRQNYQGEFEQGHLTYSTGTYANQYVQVDFIDQPLNEINTKYNLPLATNSDLPVWIFEMEFDGRYNFDLRIEASRAFLLGAVLGNPVTANDLTNGGDYYVRYYIQINSDAAVELNKTNYTNGFDGSTVYTYSDVHDFTKGTIVRIYGLFGASDLPFANVLFYWGKVNSHVLNSSGVPSFTFRDVPSESVNPTFLSIVADTTYPDSNAFAFLLHDVGGQIMDRITSINQSFYSEILGSVQTNYRSYLADGCLWRNVLMRGLQLRQYSLSEKAFFQSFNQWWNGVNPIFNLGLAYDIVNGQEVIRVEDKEYFFDPTPSIFIDNVYELIREYDKNMIYKKIEIGYNKWKSEDISGIDDPQTKHTYATRFQKVGTDINLYSEFIAASLAIEVTRRQTIKKSKDYKFDDDTFIIAINGDNVSPDRYRPELNENLNYVTNLLNFETRYNLRLTPARNLLRWIKFLNNGLQSYVGSVYKFTFGEGNYDMVSDMVTSTPGCDGDFAGAPLSEKQNIEVTDEYVFLPQEFTIEINLAWEDYKTIRNNRRKAIAISQTDTDHAAFFIKSIEYEVVKGRASMKLWPVEPFEISVVDFVPTTQVCEADDCEDAITDSFDEDLVDQFGNCITI